MLTSAANGSRNGALLPLSRLPSKKTNDSHTTRRLVHAKGVGVFGEFIVTNKDIAKYTDASFLQPDSKGKSKTTRLLARFSTIAGELGYPDTVRDAKGAAFKFYTEEGNLDWVFLNPVSILYLPRTKSYAN